MYDALCPCGCSGDMYQCAYASTCQTCGAKYAGHGYGQTDGQCQMCERGETPEIAECPDCKRRFPQTGDDDDMTECPVCLDLSKGKHISPLKIVKRIKRGHNDLREDGLLPAANNRNNTNA